MKGNEMKWMERKRKQKHPKILLSLNCWGGGWFINHFPKLIWETGKTQYVNGGILDIGIVFRSSLYRFTVFGACTYDMVLQKSKIYIIEIVCVHDARWSLLTFSGQFWHNWNSTKWKPCGDRMGDLCTKRVSVWYRFGYRFGTSQKLEKGNNATMKMAARTMKYHIQSKLCKQTWMN